MNSEHSKEAALGSFWSIAGNIAMRLVSFFYTIYITYMLLSKTETLGTFQLALSLATIVTVVSDLGMSGAVTRYTPFFEAKNEKHKLLNLLKTSYFVLFISGVFFGLLLWMSASFISDFYQNPELIYPISCFSFFIFLSGILYLNNAYLTGLGYIKKVQKIQNLQNLMKLIFTIIFFYFFGPNMISLVIPFLFSYVIALVISVWEIILVNNIRGLFPLNSSLDIAFVKELIPFGVMFGLINTFSTLISSSDKSIIGYFLDESAVAIYSNATTIPSAIFLLPWAISSIFFPMMSRYVAKSDLNQLKISIQTYQRWVFFLMIPPLLILLAYPSKILGLIYPSPYTQGSEAMAIFSLGLLIQSSYVAISFALAAMRFVRIEFFIVVTGAISNILLNVLLIPVFGINGAAIGTLISFMIMGVFFNYYSIKLINYKMNSELPKILFSGLICLIILSFISPFFDFVLSFFQNGSQFYLEKIVGLIIFVFFTLLSFILFFVFSLFLKCLHKEDVSLVLSAMKKIKLPMKLISLIESILLFGVRIQ